MEFYLFMQLIVDNLSLVLVKKNIILEKWINQVNQRTTSSVKKILVANKIDLKGDNIR